MAVLLQIKNARKSYGDQVLLDGAETTLSDNVRYGFVGRNGAGKSTLLRAILGEEQLDRGEVILHPKLQLGYLRQHDLFCRARRPSASTVFLTNAMSVFAIRRAALCFVSRSATCCG